MRKRIPYVVSVEKRKDRRGTYPPDLTLYPDMKSVQEALVQMSTDKDSIVLESGYIQLPWAMVKPRRSTVLVHSSLVQLIQATDSDDKSNEFRFVVGFWLNEALRAGIKIGRKLEREKIQREAPLFFKPKRAAT